LYIVSTPIGNPEDITIRAIRVLREAATIAAEDPQQSQALLKHYGIDTPVTSYHNFNKEGKTAVLVEYLRIGQNVALVVDAGTPVVSDPGAFLIAKALESGIRVIPVPGASAVLAAVSVSGISCDTFTFLGFLPRTAGPRRRLLESLAPERRTVVLFEAPHRLRPTLEVIREVFGNCRIMLAKDLTKPSEACVRGPVEELLKSIGFEPVAGELTLVIEADPHSKRQRTAGAGKKRVTRRRVFES
jgi:16S rRNA (cytidine1402-2'-O)-methyltransferase